jgi:3-deoxy-D-manno-octulosonate 8-phosphate phosphatase (KDO 8-P phosphatase)
MDSKILSDKLSKVKMLVMDVDGTMTNAKVYYSNIGEELKEFSIRDGMGIELLRKGRIKTAIITSEDSQIVTARASKLKIENIILGSRNKKKDLLDLAQKLSIQNECIAYIGDDVNDIQVMEAVGVSACPADACSEVKKTASYICENAGGNGAVREFAEMILLSQDKSIIIDENW